MTSANKRTLGVLLIILAVPLVLWAALFASRMRAQVASIQSVETDSSVGSIGRGEAYPDMMPGVPVDMMDDQGFSTVGMMPPFYPEPSPTGGVTAGEADQKIIKNGYLDLVVEDVSSTLSKIRTFASGVGGYEQTSSVSEREDGTKEGSIVVRVPAEEFEGVVNEIKTYATLVQTETTSGQDVTEEYTDLEAQLVSAEAQRAQYLEILEKATTVEEILMVQPYLNSIESTITYLKGRIQYLSNLTGYSTVTVALSEEAKVRLPTKEFRLDTIVSQAVQALVDLGQAFAVVAIWFVIVGGGVALPLGLLTWILLTIVLKLMRRK